MRDGICYLAVFYFAPKEIPRKYPAEQTEPSLRELYGFPAHTQTCFTGSQKNSKHWARSPMPRIFGDFASGKMLQKSYIKGIPPDPLVSIENDTLCKAITYPKNDQKLKVMRYGEPHEKE